MTNSNYQDFLNNLGARESAGHGGYLAENSAHYLGKYQMSESALIDAGYYTRQGDSTPGVNDWTGRWTGKDGVNNKDNYLANPQAQENAARAYQQKNWGYITYYKLDKYVGQNINGVIITQSGLLAGYHLVGIGNSSHPGLKNFLESNGQIIPRDGNGTPVTEYIQKFGDYSIPFEVKNKSLLDKISATLGDGTFQNAVFYQEFDENGNPISPFNQKQFSYKDAIEEINIVTFNTEKNIEETTVFSVIKEGFYTIIDNVKVAVTDFITQTIESTQHLASFIGHQLESAFSPIFNTLFSNEDSSKDSSGQKFFLIFLLQFLLIASTEIAAKEIIDKKSDYSKYYFKGHFSKEGEVINGITYPYAYYFVIYDNKIFLTTGNNKGMNDQEKFPDGKFDLETLNGTELIIGVKNGAIFSMGINSLSVKELSSVHSCLNSSFLHNFYSVYFLQKNGNFVIKNNRNKNSVKIYKITNNDDIDFISIIDGKYVAPADDFGFSDEFVDNQNVLCFIKSADKNLLISGIKSEGKCFLKVKNCNIIK